MKKLLFFVTLLFACWQLNAADYSNENYIQKYGRLTLNGNQLSDATGKAVQLKGWSTFGLQWQTNCYTQNAFQAMKEWGANIVRLAMYVTEGGYENGRDAMKGRIKQYIDQTANIGIYCIVDWHVLKEGNPNDNAYMSQDPEDFFREICSYVKSKNYIHVIYEICNEPHDCSWNDIKTYANKVLPVIQQNDPYSIVIVGTPQWDQLIDQAQNDPITNYNQLNIMYAFHYYACSHSQFLPKLKTAAGKIPCFVSEWGAVDFDGNGSAICPGPSDQLMAVTDGDNDGKVKLSWCFWQWGDKNELSSSIKSCGSSYDESNLRDSGKYIITKLCGDGNCTTTVTTEGPFGGTAQPIPSNGVWFQVAYYDLGGEGYAYHDGNGSDDEAKCCNAGGNWGSDYSFRGTENTDGQPSHVTCEEDADCVDVSKCAGVPTASGTYTYSDYNLCYIENDEWLKYTVEVAEAGYYSFRYMAGLGAGCKEATISLSLKDGNDLINTGIATYEDGTETQIESFAFSGTESSEVPNAAGDWEIWAWKNPFQKGGKRESKNLTVLFREAGTYVLTLSFVTEGTNLGPFDFSKKTAYTGAGYDRSNVEEVSTNGQNVAIYPNPVEDVLNVNIDVEKVEIINFAGVALTADSKNINVSNLAAGVYIAKIYALDGSVIVKQFIKK